MEFEIWRLTGAEKLELNWKILRIFFLEVGFGVRRVQTVEAL
jgi:hypothetical protein